MTDLVVVQQTNQWHRLKGLVLDSVFFNRSPAASTISASNEFIAWYGA